MVGEFRRARPARVDSFRRGACRGSVGVRDPGSMGRVAALSAAAVLLLGIAALGASAVTPTIIGGRISGCRLTACDAFNTIRGFSMSSAAFRAAPSSIASGLALATDDLEVAPAERRRVMQGLGVSLDPSCSATRHTPVLSTWRPRLSSRSATPQTRRNWGASNTSFVERDSESALRGFDDHQSIVSVAAADGTQATAVRRDYRDLVAVLPASIRSGQPGCQGGDGSAS